MMMMRHLLTTALQLQLHRELVLVSPRRHLNQLHQWREPLPLLLPQLRRPPPLRAQALALRPAKAARIRIAKPQQQLQLQLLLPRRQLVLRQRRLAALARSPPVAKPALLLVLLHVVQVLGRCQAAISTMTSCPWCQRCAECAMQRRAAP